MMDNRTLTRNCYAALTAGRLNEIDELSDFAMNIDDMVAEGDKAFVRVTMQGIQRAEFLGIASKGKPMLVPVADVLRFEDGRIVEHWGLIDTGQLMQQLL